MNWTMPELVKSSVWSPAGTRLALGTTAWPRSAKNSTKRRRISAAGNEQILGSGPGWAVRWPHGTEQAAAGGMAPPDPRGGAGAGARSKRTERRHSVEPAITAPTISAERQAAREAGRATRIRWPAVSRGAAAAEPLGQVSELIAGGPRSGGPGSRER